MTVMSAPIPLKTRVEAGAASRQGAAPARPLLRLDGISKVFSNGVTALTGVDLDHPARRVRQPARAVGLRQVDAAEADRGARGADRRHHRLAAVRPMTPSGAPEPSLGFVFQEPTLLPWRTVADNVHLPLMLAGIAQARRQASASPRRWRWSGCRRSPTPIRASSPAA